ncbi:MAG: transposase [Candidatus Pacebacteria bacterium]|nr:transposase [Candidatus Paceibacterota bacterium]
MITKEAKERLKILNFWKEYGLKAMTDAYGAKRSTLYEWQKTYQESERKIESLNPKSQAPINRRKRITDYKIINEIRRLRTEVCPNMGKEKVKKDLDKFCTINNLEIISASTIGRIIKEKKIYHHRQKIYHDGRIKTVKRVKKLRKPKEFVAEYKGDLIEIDTIVKFTYGMKRYIITAIDVKTRYTFAWAYKKHDSASVKDFFQKLETTFPYKIKAVQTDNGSEFHKFFRDYLKEKKAVHYWNYPGQPYRNGHVEKYNRTIQEEFVDWNESLLEYPNKFNEKLMDWLIWYNTKRYHWSLDLQSPVDYMINHNLLSRMCWTNTIL